MQERPVAEGQVACCPVAIAMAPKFPVTPRVCPRCCKTVASLPQPELGGEQVQLLAGVSHHM